MRLSWVFINTEPERAHRRIDLTYQFPIVTFEFASGEQNLEFQEEADECTYAEHRMSPMCTLDELVDLARHHLLDVATDERQSHARGIDVELDRRRRADQHVTLDLNPTSSKGDHASECEQ